MSEQHDEGEANAEARRRWTAPLTFFLILALPAAVYAVVLLDGSAGSSPAPGSPLPPVPTTSAGTRGAPASPSPAPTP